MRVCLDARGNHFGGVYTYTEALLRTLPKVAPYFDFLVLLDERQLEEGRLTTYMEHRVASVLSPLKMIWWNNTKLPHFLKTENIDLYHGLKHFGLRYPAGEKCKMIWTLHSAGWWLFPKMFSLRERLFWSLYYIIGAKRLDRVICVSHADKIAFSESTSVDVNKISVTHLASNSRFSQVDSSSILKKAREKFSLPRKYMIFVGTIYPFKNIETIIRAFSRAIKLGTLPHDLVIVGGTSPAYGERYRESLVKLSIEEAVEDRIHWIGKVFDELPALYSMADLLIFPSHFESFGQPLLEAMACGVPVICSNVACLPEVVADAGLLHTPDDVDGIAEDVVKVLENTQLRQQLIEKGNKRVKHFSWERCTRETIQIYKDVLGLAPKAAQ